MKVRALVTEGNYLFAGKIYEVRESEYSECYILIADDGDEIVKFKSKFEVMKDDSSLRASQYTFSINHLSQVDVDLMKSDLSYKNPVALVSTPDGRTYAAIHTSWFSKVAACSIDIQELTESFSRAIEPKDDYNMNLVKDVSALLKLIKDVKKSPYADPTRGVVKVTVPEGL